MDAFNLDPHADDQKLVAQVLEYYTDTFKQSPDTLAYLHDRGITNDQVIDTFRIGYANRTLGLKLPPKQKKAGRLIRGRLEQLGLYRGTGREHFNGCVVFPVLAADGTGQIVDLYGRKTNNHLRPGTPMDMFLGEERRGVWNVEAFAKSDEIILCPSIFDALTFWNHGYRNVTCTFGADALTDDHLAAFQEFKVRRVLVVNERITARLLDAGLECFRLVLPVNLNVNAYALEASDPADALGSLIRKAEWLGKGQAPLPTGVPFKAEPLPAPTLDVSPLAPSIPLPVTDSVALKPAPEPSVEPPPTIRSASPVPPAPPLIDAQVNEDEVLLTLGDRHYRIRCWTKNLSFDQFKVNVLVHGDTGMFVDTFDLYAAKHRRAFVVQAAQELNVEEQTIKKDLGRVLLKLEELQDVHIAETLTPKESQPQMSSADRDEALRLLRDPSLLDRIVADFDIVGERTNKLVGYLAAISRKLDEPLAVVIQSSSAAGKTTLMDAVLAFVPPEDLVKYSAVTGQSLFYVGEADLRHKILAIVEEEGAERASHALKLLQSEGELTIASTGKDSTNGRLVTHEYRVEGPVMIFLTTTNLQVDEELFNRCLVLTVSEEREQTRAIHQAQRHQQTLTGLLARQERQQKRNLHRNAQRLLRPLLVANPYAEALTFLDDKTRTRRDHAKYLTLIRTITLLHQHQRTIRTVEHHGQKIEFIEVHLDDIAVANQLTHEVLGRSLDEVPPQTRRLLERIATMVGAACEERGIDRADFRFSRRDVREHTGWGQTQLKVHLKRLEDLEYLLVHRGGRGQSFVYELVFDQPCSDGQRVLSRLLDVEQIRRNLSAASGEKSPPGRPQVGPKSAASRASEIDASPQTAAV